MWNVDDEVYLFDIDRLGMQVVKATISKIDKPETPDSPGVFDVKSAYFSNAGRYDTVRSDLLYSATPEGYNRALLSMHQLWTERYRRMRSEIERMEKYVKETKENLERHMRLIK